MEPHFEAALRDVTARRPQWRLAAAQRLGSPDPGQEARAVEGLTRLSADPHPHVRRAALSSLTRLASPSGVEPAIARLDDPDPDVRELATIALAELGGERAEEALRAGLYSAHAEVRYQAVLGYAQHCPEDAARRLPRLLEDPDNKVLAQVLGALASLDEASPDWLPRARELLDHPVATARHAAALALAAHREARAVPVLEEATADREHGLDAVEALAGYPAPVASDILLRLTERLLASPLLKAAAAGALVRLGDPRGVRALQRMLGSWRAITRQLALAQAARLEEVALGPALARLARRPRGVDPSLLVEALARLAAHSPEARAGLERLAGRRDEIGRSARQALERLPSPPVG